MNLICVFFILQEELHEKLKKNLYDGVNTFTMCVCSHDNRQRKLLYIEELTLRIQP